MSGEAEVGMQVVSVNTGSARLIANGKKVTVSGIFKEPLGGAVYVSGSGLAGDAVCDTENHGGSDQAVYVYGALDYEWWERELGVAIEPGTFGENLTISGVRSSDFRIGDRLRIGPVVLEVTAPRIPCSTFAVRMGDATWVKRFRQAERPGFYCRVLQEGPVRAGDAVTVAAHEGETVSVLEMFRDYFSPVRDEATIRRYLAAPIAIRARADQEEHLRRLLAAR